MNPKTRNIIIVCFLFMSFLPFLLLTDLFPFMRLGMFAETVKSAAQKEVFTIEIITDQGTIERLDNRQTSLDESHLNYLVRNYHYSNRLDLFHASIKTSGLLKEGEQLRIVQKTLQADGWKNNVLIEE